MKYGIKKDHYFSEHFEVRTKSGILLAVVYYAPAYTKTSESRILTNLSGVADNALGEPLRSAMEAARNNGIDVLSFETPALSVSLEGIYCPEQKEFFNPDKHSFARHTLGALRAFESPYVRKRIEKSVYNISARHSAGANTAHHLNRVSKIVRDSSDAHILFQPYVATAPELQLGKTHPAWSKVKKFKRPAQRIIDGQVYEIRTCAGMFDLTPPPEWIKKFHDYELFVQNVIATTKAENRGINILAGNECLIKNVWGMIPENKLIYVVLGTNDLYGGFNLNYPIFSEMAKMHPELVKIKIIEGGNHYLDNCKPDLNKWLDETFKDLGQRRR